MCVSRYHNGLGVINKSLMCDACPFASCLCTNFGHKEFHPSSNFFVTNLQTHWNNVNIKQKIDLKHYSVSTTAGIGGWGVT